MILFPSSFPQLGLKSIKAHLLPSYTRYHCKAELQCASSSKGNNPRWKEEVRPMWPMVSLTLTTLQPADPEQTRVQDTNGGRGCEESRLAPALRLRARYHSSRLETIKNPSCHALAVLRAGRGHTMIVRKTGKSSQHSRERTLSGKTRTEKFPFRIWFKCTKPWVPPPTWHKLGTVTHASNPSTQEVVTGGLTQGRSQLHIKLGPN